MWLAGDVVVARMRSRRDSGNYLPTIMSARSLSLERERDRERDLATNVGSRNNRIHRIMCSRQAYVLHVYALESTGRTKTWAGIMSQAHSHYVIGREAVFSDWRQITLISFRYRHQITTMLSAILWHIDGSMCNVVKGADNVPNSVKFYCARRICKTCAVMHEKCQ